MRALVPAVAVAILLAGCSSPKPQQTTVTDSVTVGGATAHAVSVFLAAGHALRWNWTSDGALRFDIHDEGNGTEHVVQQGLSGEGTFTPTMEGPYTLQWENRGNVSVALTYRFTGDALE